MNRDDETKTFSLIQGNDSCGNDFAVCSLHHAISSDRGILVHGRVDPVDEWIQLFS